MARIAGKAGEVEIDATVPATVYGVTNWELDYQGDAIDVTGMGDSGARTFIGGLVGGSATIECFEDGAHALNTDIRPGLGVTANLRYVTTDLTSWNGTGYITGLRPRVAVDGAVQWTITVQFSGEIAYD